MLLVYRAMHKRWPDAAAPLVEYVSNWETGRTELAGAYDTALASVFYASVSLDRPQAHQPLPRELVALLASVLDEKLDAAALANLPRHLIATKVSRRLKADADLYRAELSRSWKIQLDLPLDARPDAPSRRIDALLLSSPQDVTVLKLLARPDTVHSSYQRGFELMAVHAPNEAHAYGRHTITLAPESPGTLADLALRLEHLEGPTTADGEARLTGKPRFAHQPPELDGLADPWYSDGYAWAGGRSTLVAPPFEGTRLTREQIWETVWERFNLGRNIHVTSARSIFVKPFRASKGFTVERLTSLGFAISHLGGAGRGLLPPVAQSFLGDEHHRDVTHLERAGDGFTVHVSLYPSELVLIWVERTFEKTNLFELCRAQSALASGGGLDELPHVTQLESMLNPVGLNRWLVYGAYRINRARSSMIDDSRCVQGLFHALASGSSPSLQSLPSDSVLAAATVHRAGEVEHHFTATGGARLLLDLEDEHTPPLLDQDFALFLLTTGQRYAAFEISRRMAELERKGRRSRWSALRPAGDVRGDVMFFINALWYARVSDDPALDSRYDAWRVLHGMPETIEALRSQTSELDEYRKERFESMVALLVFVFLPITIVCGFFSGAQFNEMDTHVGWPWTTGGWMIFLAYTGVFTVVVFGTVVLGRLLTFRRR